MNSKSSYFFVVLLSLVPLMFLMFCYIMFMALILSNLVTNIWVLLTLTSICSGSTVPVSVVLAAKFGLTNPVELDFRPYFYFFIQPWDCYRWVVRKRNPRQVFRTEDLPQETIDAIKNSRMDPKHDHLNQLLEFDDEME